MVPPPPHPPPPTAARPRAIALVPRPPLDIHLRVAVVRDDGDVGRLLLGGGGGGGGIGSEKGEAEGATTKRKKEADNAKEESSLNNDSGNSNKKEIPVPTIATVRRYDADVPPDHALPRSYVRHVRPTYEEVVDETVEYNVDADDEAWWKEDEDFGPRAIARIATTTTGNDGDGVEEGSDRQRQRQNHPAAARSATAASAAEKERATKKERGRNRKTGKFAKKNPPSAKKTNGDAKGDAGADCIDGMNDHGSNAENASIDATPPPSVAISAPPHDEPTWTVERVLLHNPKYLHSRHSTAQLINRYNPKLSLKSFERMIDVLEKSTGFESIVTIARAEDILVRKMPELVDAFGPLSAKERRLEEEEEEDRYLARCRTEHNDDDAPSQRPPPLVPDLARPIALPTVIRRVYDCWMSKRSRLRKPLLRRYWPPTAATDTNPHQVFRRHDKEKRRLRKKRQNDVEAYGKMRRLRADFEGVRALCELILRREEVHGTLVEMTNDYFEERLHGYVDTTGAPRESGLNEWSIESVVRVPKYFDDGPILKMKGVKKRKRAPLQPQGSARSIDGRGPSPMPPRAGAPVGHPSHRPHATANNVPSQQHGGPGPRHPGPMAHPAPPTSLLPPKNIVVAGHDGGLPAPNFLQPLASRESRPVSAWEDSHVPLSSSMPTYVNGRPVVDPNNFRHRPRLGRGGRIVVDRVPLPFSAPPGGRLGVAPPTVVTYGSLMERCGYDLAALGADGPCYSIHNFGLDNNNNDGPSCGPRNISGKGTDARSAPKVPPARCFADLLPKSLGDPAALSRKIEEICAEGLIEDYRAHGNDGAVAAAASGSSASSFKAGRSAASSVAGSAVAEALAEEMDEVLVPMEDWMEAPDAMRIYGSEKFVIGPF